MTFATELQAVALDLLSEFGQAFTATRDVEGNFDVTTGATIGNTNSTYTGYGHPGAYTSDEVDGSTVLASDLKFTVYTTTTPLVGDTIVVDTETHRVMSVKKTKAQGINIVYTLQLRV